MFLACGDALFDVFQTPSDSLTSLDLSAHIGGSPLNVALGLARLGNPVGYLTANSTDTLGEKIQTFMTSNHIDTRYVARCDRNTSLAMVSVNAAGHPSYAFYIEGGADVSLSESQLPRDTEFDAISLGSYSTVVEPCASSLATLVARAQDSSVIAYDPNVRPSIQPDRAVWLDAFERLGSQADLIKLSDEDIEFLSPGSSVETFARAALELGPAWVVVTRGPDGAIAFSREQTLEVPGRKVEVIDTVGAGDTFQAAMLDALHRQGELKRDLLPGADMAAAVSWAIAAAAVTCSRRGADLPTREAVLEALA
ncbi:MAG: carbohydrate kinase family protein [Litorivicinus sp.]